MGNSTSGQYSDIASGFSNGPDDTFESVDVNKPVKFDNGSSSFEYEDILSLKVSEDKIDISKSPIKEGETYEDYLGGLTDIENLSSDQIDDMKDFYESVTCPDILGNITDWIMDLLGGLLDCGLLNEVAKIGTIVGSNTLTSHKPTIVADTLSNFSLGGCGPSIPGSCISINGLQYNDFSDYANGTFMDTLDSIDPKWDVLEDMKDSIEPPFGGSSKSGSDSNDVPTYSPTDLSVFGSCSKDASMLFSFSDRTKEAALVGSGRSVNHVSDLRSQYRPYGH